VTTPTYDRKMTAVLLVDPYNDFLSEGGKLWPRAKPIAEEVVALGQARSGTARSLSGEHPCSAGACSPT
jgi:hypothetical protein